MKYIRTYESFKNEKNIPVNEGIMDVLKAAGGALKNFLTNMLAPFKSLKDDFKKGMKLEEVKTKISKALDDVLKTYTDNIGKAKDEKEITDMTSGFVTEIAEKMSEFDKEIKTIKEAKIFEGLGQDALIGARVMFSMLQDEYNKKKQEFDTKFAQAKDLATKKSVAIANLKALIDEAKKKISDEKLLKQATEKYKTDNKIETTGGGNGTIVLDWGDVEVELTSVNEKNPGYYQVQKSGSKKLLVNDLVKIAGEVKKGDKAKMTDILRGEKPADMLKLPDGTIGYETGSLERIVVDGKEVENYKFEAGANADDEGTIKTELGKLKGNPDQMKKVAGIIPKIVANIGDDAKLKAVDTALA